MSFPPCPSPPPPMPSPDLVPASLPSPPPFTKKPSRTRLAVLPKRLLNHALSHEALPHASGSLRSGDDAHKADSRCRPSPPPISSSRTLKRALSHLPLRRRSPPPSPAVRSPPPPVPPIPAFVFTTNHSVIRQSQSPFPSRAPPLDLYLDHPREDLANMRCESQAGGALTCMRFLAVHSQTGQCGA